MCVRLNHRRRPTRVLGSLPARASWLTLVVEIPSMIATVGPVSHTSVSSVGALVWHPAQPSSRRSVPVQRRARSPRLNGLQLERRHAPRSPRAAHQRASAHRTMHLRGAAPSDRRGRFPRHPSPRVGRHAGIVCTPEPRSARWRTSGYLNEGMPARGGCRTWRRWASRSRGRGSRRTAGVPARVSPRCAGRGSPCVANQRPAVTTAPSFSLNLIAALTGVCDGQPSGGESCAVRSPNGRLAVTGEGDGAAPPLAEPPTLAHGGHRARLSSSTQG